MTALADTNGTGASAGTKSFSYDANGNLIHDGRKDLDLSWNLLNLVSGAVMHGSDNNTEDSSLTYAWLSDGMKVSAVAEDGNGNGVQKRYLGSFVYTSTSGSSAEPPMEVESIAWDEGRIFFNFPEVVDSMGVVDTPVGEEAVIDSLIVVDTAAVAGWFRDCWFAGDHLGNVRSVIDITSDLVAPQILEQNDYLPYGTKIQNPNHAAIPMNNRWRYAGKEAQRFGSLDLSLLDFGARMYDPFTARWISIDKMSQTRLFSSPMVYGSDNPINRIDVDGNTDWGLVKKGVETILIGAGTLGAGVALTGSTAGAGIALGCLLTVDGFTAIGTGIAMTMTGFITPDEKVDPSLAEQIPTDLTNALSKSADMLAGNENNDIETVTSIATTTIGVSTFTLNPQNIGELISDLGTIVQVGNTSQQVNSLIGVIQSRTQQTVSSYETERSLYNEEWKEHLWTPNY